MSDAAGQMLSEGAAGGDRALVDGLDAYGVPLDYEEDQEAPTGPEVSLDDESLGAELDAFHQLPAYARKVYLEGLDEDQRVAFLANGIAVPVHVDVAENPTWIEPSDSEFRPLMELARSTVEAGVRRLEGGRLALSDETLTRFENLRAMAEATPGDDDRHIKATQEMARIIEAADLQIAEAMPFGRPKRTESGQRADGSGYVRQQDAHGRVREIDVTAEDMAAMEAEGLAPAPSYANPADEFPDPASVTEEMMAGWDHLKWQRFDRAYPQYSRALMGDPMPAALIMRPSTRRW